MADISKTIIPRSDQLNADSLVTGDMVVKVTRVSVIDSQEQPVSVFYEGDEKRPFKPCLTSRKILARAWGTETDVWVGRWLKLYRDPEVTWGGEAVGGIRISGMSHIEKDFKMALAASKKAKKVWAVAKIDPPTPIDTRAAFQDAERRNKAELAARQGTVTFRAFWQDELSKAERQDFADDLPRLKALAADADQRGAPTEADPFTPDDEPQEREPGEEG